MKVKIECFSLYIRFLYQELIKLISEKHIFKFNILLNNIFNKNIRISKPKFKNNIQFQLSSLLIVNKYASFGISQFAYNIIKQLLIPTGCLNYEYTITKHHMVTVPL